MYVGNSVDADDEYTLPTDWDKHDYSSFTGTFDNLMFSTCAFRNNTKLTKIQERRFLWRIKKTASLM